MRYGQLADAFIRTAQRHPERLALRCTDGDLTYRQLHDSALACADMILTVSRAAEPGSPVSIEVTRNRASVVAILAALLSGRSYVPIDAGYPDARKLFLRLDCGAGVQIDATGSEPSVAAGQQDAAAPDPDAAYVIYTSGSTGVPKGCVVTHRNVLSLFEATEKDFAPQPSDVCSVIHSLAFDFSVWELWTAWLYGGTAWLASRDTVTDPEALIAELAEHEVTRLSATPAMFGYLVTALARSGVMLPGLRSVVLGGEAARLPDVATFKRLSFGARAQVTNMYGITETTVHVTHRELDGTEVAQRPGATPIGRPIASLTMCLRGPAGQEVPAGEAGEIWIAGAGVCAGYLNRPELTGTRFVTDQAGCRWYRSGDLAYYDGNEYHYLGRADRQVQLRGYRIELGEVEAVLESLDGVARAVACLEGRSGTDLPALVCYVALGPATRAVTARQLITEAGRLLPPQAVPQVIRLVADLPLTSNGKVDLAALQAAAQARTARGGPL